MDNTSTHTDTGPIRSCCWGKWARKSDCQVRHGNMSQHSIALTNPNSISGNRHFKRSLLVFWPTDLTQHEFTLFTRRHYDVMSLLINLVHQIKDKLCFGFIPMWWERFIQSTSTCCSQVLFIDFNPPVKKLPLSGDRWTDAQQLRTGHWSATGRACCCHPDDQTLQCKGAAALSRAPSGCLSCPPYL